MNKLIFIAAFLLGNIALQAQKLQGIARDSATNEIIPYAHIYNVSKRTVTASDLKGFFTIDAQEGDTILASSVGYFWSKKTVGSNTDMLFIKMNKMVYGLDEVVIRKKYTQEAFITEIVLMKPKDSVSFNLPNMPTATSQTPPKYKSPLSFNLDAIYNKFSRKGKNKIKAQELIATSYKTPIINKKYNKTIVEEITNLKDKELEEFIAFCNFTDDYIYQTSEYQLQQMILFKLGIFNSNKTINSDTSQTSNKS